MVSSLQLGSLIEWFNMIVLKTIADYISRGFESHNFRKKKINIIRQLKIHMVTRSKVCQN